MRYGKQGKSYTEACGECHAVVGCRQDGQMCYRMQAWKAPKKYGCAPHSSVENHGLNKQTQSIQGGRQVGQKASSTLLGKL